MPLFAAAVGRVTAFRGCESNLTKQILGYKSLWRKQEIEKLRACGLCPAAKSGGDAGRRRRDARAVQSGRF
jgi:hypothetical protein